MSIFAPLLQPLDDAVMFTLLAPACLWVVAQIALSIRQAMLRYRTDGEDIRGWISVSLFGAIALGALWAAADQRDIPLVAGADAAIACYAVRRARGAAGQPKILAR